MKKIILILLVLGLASPAFGDDYVKSIFTVKYVNGSPQFPSGVELYGWSAMEPVTGNGFVNMTVVARKSEMDKLKKLVKAKELVYSKDILIMNDPAEKQLETLWRENEKAY